MGVASAARCGEKERATPEADQENTEGRATGIEIESPWADREEVTAFSGFKSKTKLEKLLA